MRKTLLTEDEDRKQLQRTRDLILLPFMALYCGAVVANEIGIRIRMGAGMLIGGRYERIGPDDEHSFSRYNRIR